MLFLFYLPFFKKRIRCDAIQNAARPSLLGGGGIDRRIHQVAGPELKQYCATLPLIREKIRCRNGQTKISPAFGNLKCKFVLHSVGPHRDLHKEEEGDQLLIQACTKTTTILNVLKLLLF